MLTTQGRWQFKKLLVTAIGQICHLSPSIRRKNPCCRYKPCYKQKVLSITFIELSDFIGAKSYRLIILQPKKTTAYTATGKRRTIVHRLSIRTFEWLPLQRLNGGHGKRVIKLAKLASVFMSLGKYLHSEHFWKVTKNDHHLIFSAPNIEQLMWRGWDFLDVLVTFD